MNNKKEKEEKIKRFYTCLRTIALTYSEKGAINNIPEMYNAISDICDEYYTDSEIEPKEVCTRNLFKQVTLTVVLSMDMLGRIGAVNGKEEMKPFRDVNAILSQIIIKCLFNPCDACADYDNCKKFHVKSTKKNTKKEN